MITFITSRSKTRSIATLVFAAVVATAVGATKPNIVFILADDLGYTDLACFGSQYYQTPNIDRLASQGTKFTCGYTGGPNCQPTRAALLSGQYGPRTGVYTVGGIDRFDWQSRPLKPVENVTRLPLDKKLFPEVLKAAGYATGMFGKWHLGQDGPYHPARRGFDEAIVSMGAHFNFETTPHVDYPKDTYLADFLTEKAVDFITRHRAEPFLLYLPHFAVHKPLEAKPQLIAHFKTRAAAGGHHDPTYAAMIASVDQSVGKIVAVLEQLNLATNTLVVFSSDNGGVGGYVREGIKQAGDITDNAPLRGGKGMLYEGGIRVPYIFRWPGRIPQAKVSTYPITSVDLYPTLLEIAGVKTPANSVLDGSSYARVLLASESAVPPNRALFWHFPGYLGAGAGSWRTTPAGAIRSGSWKLLEFFEDGRLELYNLENDLGETNNLARVHPAMTQELHNQLKEWRSRIKAPMPQLNSAPHTPAAAGKKKRRAARNEE